MSEQPLPRSICALLCLPGLAIASLLGNMHFPVTDFTGFWIGAKLLGTPQLYDIPANLALQRTLTGHTEEALIYVRPPFFAAAMKVFTLMPYASALIVWKLLLVGALAGFVAIFPLTPRRYAALALCWSILVPINIAIPNDAPLILLLISLAMVCWRRNSPFLSGVILGLCLAKFHFLIFLPLLLLRRQYRRVLEGFAATASILVAINFLTQPDWLRLYWRALNMPQRNMNWRPSLMPNFYAAFFRTGHPGIGVALGAVLLGLILLRVCRGFPFEVALAFCLLGGILVSPHTNNVDALLAVPALLAIATGFSQACTVAACLLLSPAGAMLYCLGPLSVGPALFVGACCLLLTYCASAQPQPRFNAVSAINHRDITTKCE